MAYALWDVICQGDHHIESKFLLDQCQVQHPMMKSESSVDFYTLFLTVYLGSII